MIQFKRGSTSSWKRLKKPLAAGQPGYDKDKHKIKVGDGERLWDKLPYAGISEEEVLDSEENAKKRLMLDPGSMAIMTYGEEGPDKNTVGQLYLQYYDAEPEVDYIVEAGFIPNNWTYQKWKSGIARCSITFEFDTPIQASLGSALYQNSNNMKSLEYPITFKEIPSETASIQSAGGLVWLAVAKDGMNTKEQAATYRIVSPDRLNNATYRISLQVEGFWK